MRVSPEILLQMLKGGRKRLGEALVEQQLLSEDDLQMALIYQKAQPGKRLGTVLRELGMVGSLDFIEALTSNMSVVKAYNES